jgi:deazaflavin-dependent oxidoreductase (nitroreductase family)
MASRRDVRAEGPVAQGAAMLGLAKESIMYTDEHNGRKRMLRRFVVVAAGLVATVATVFASPVLMPRILRRHPDWLRLAVFKRYADFRRRRAGREHSVTAVLTHVGRRSGRTYQTPLGAFPYGDGFLVSLSYGSQTDWCRNVMAAGECTLAWRGQTYQLERPEIISGSQVFETLPVLPRILLRGGGIHDFLWLHKKEVKAGNGTDIGA